MQLSPDNIILWQHGFVKLNMTIVSTWGLMAFLVIGSKLITSKIYKQKNRSRPQNILEIIVISIDKQIKDVGLTESRKFMPFLGALFLFLITASLFTIFPFYIAPTGSLSTTAALALCVFVSVPLFGIVELGIKGYFKAYLKPTFIMLPFHIISELTRTLALAVRLFGNMMSGTMTLGIIVSIAPWFFPIFMRTLGLITGMVQAYIFAVLATVYIAAATFTQENKKTDTKNLTLKQ